MIVKEIYYLERLTTAKYEHIEMSATAVMEEGEEFLTSMMSLKTLVHTALTLKKEDLEETVGSPVEEVKEEVKEEKPKQTRTRKPKTEEVKEGVAVEKVEAEVVVEEKKTKSVNTLYSTDVKAHKDMLAAYLNATFKDSWKKNPELKNISASLVGKEFLGPQGNILESFKDLLESHFGA